MTRIYIEKLAERVAPMVEKDVTEKELISVIFAEAVKDLGVKAVRQIFLGDDFLSDVITLVHRIIRK